MPVAAGSPQRRACGPSKRGGGHLQALTPPSPAPAPSGPSAAPIAYSGNSGHTRGSSGDRVGEAALSSLNRAPIPATPTPTPIPQLQGDAGAGRVRSATSCGGFMSFLRFVPLQGVDNEHSHTRQCCREKTGAQCDHGARGAFSCGNLVRQTFSPICAAALRRSVETHGALQTPLMQETDYFQVAVLLHYALPYLWASPAHPLVSSVLSPSGSPLGYLPRPWSQQKTNLPPSPSVLLHQCGVDEAVSFLIRVFTMTSLQLPTIVLALVYIRKLFCSAAALPIDEDPDELLAALWQSLEVAVPPLYAHSPAHGDSPSGQPPRGYISERNLLVVAFMLANKFNDDARFTNESWRQVSRIQLSVLNAMELEFLQRVRHDLCVSEHTYVAVLKHLCNVATLLDGAIYGLQQRPPFDPRDRFSAQVESTVPVVPILLHAPLLVQPPPKSARRSKAVRAARAVHAGLSFLNSKVRHGNSRRDLADHSLGLGNCESRQPCV